MLKGPDPEAFETAVRAALEEDAAWDDITVSFLEIGDRPITARLLAVSPGVLCGMEVAKAAFQAVEPKVAFNTHMKDGERMDEGQVVARIEGEARGILSAERVALNFLQRLSGIATLTSKFVEKLSGTGVKVLDTRKTTPFLRILEKYAVRAGGGENHRFDLKEMMLVKENHIRAVGGIESLLGRLRSGRPSVKVEVEVDSPAFLMAILGARINRVMLDNFSPQEVRESVNRIRAYARTHDGFSLEVEVSGGVTLQNIKQYAIPGVDYISIGALTHSAPSLDMSIEVD